MVEPQAAQAFLAQLTQQLQTSADPAETVVRQIAAAFPHYNWVGVYWLRGDELVLGPYVGAATEHTRIPVGRGVCGSAVAENRNQIVDDVNSRENYISCSIHVKSEIVVLIRSAAGAVIGQIDADSHLLAAFDRSDEQMLEQAAALIATRITAQTVATKK
jgi:L-methionine (R)-S-oxide reductase